MLDNLIIRDTELVYLKYWMWSLSKNYHFLFLSCPKSVIGHPEGIEKNRF
jgi:hypothetical protein